VIPGYYAPSAARLTQHKDASRDSSQIKRSPVRDGFQSTECIYAHSSEACSVITVGCFRLAGNSPDGLIVKSFALCAINFREPCFRGSHTGYRGVWQLHDGRWKTRNMKLCRRPALVTGQVFLVKIVTRLPGRMRHSAKRGKLAKLFRGRTTPDFDGTTACVEILYCKPRCALDDNTPTVE